MIQDWRTQQERASRFWLRVIIWMATHWRRRWARAFLYPSVAYFLATGGQAYPSAEW